MTTAVASALPAGPFTLATLHAHGLTEHRLRSALAAGQARRVFRGVYVDAAAELDFDLRCRAAALVLSPHQVVRDRSAALIWGVDTYTAGEHELPLVLETSAVRGHAAADRSGTHGGTRDLHDDDIVAVNGIRLTTPVRTGLDLGCHLRRREAFAALSGLARAHGLTAADYAAQLPRFRRRRGVCQLRDLVGLVDPRLESAREAWTLLELHDSGLPLPTPQLEVVVDGDLFRLDLAYPWAKVAVEYDGHEWHTLTAEQRHADEHRRRLLEAAGWLVVVVRRGDFTGAARDRWIGMVRDALTPTYSNRRF